MHALISALDGYAGCCRATPQNARPMHVDTTEFQALLGAILNDVPRYRPQDPSSRIDRMTQEIEAHNHVVAFFARTGFYDQILDGRFDARSLAEAFVDATNAASTHVHTLIPLDGLELPQDELVFGGGRFILLSDPWLR